MRLFACLEEENPHRILIPRGRLLLFWLFLWATEAAVCLLWRGIFIIVALFLAVPTLYLWRIGRRLWRRYYARAWYPVCVCLVSGAAWGTRLLIERIFA